MNVQQKLKANFLMFLVLTTTPFVIAQPVKPIKQIEEPRSQKVPAIAMLIMLITVVVVAGLRR